MKYRPKPKRQRIIPIAAVPDPMGNRASRRMAAKEAKGKKTEHK